MTPGGEGHGGRGHGAKVETQIVECGSRHKNFLISHKTVANRVEAVVVLVVGATSMREYLGLLGTNLGGPFCEVRGHGAKRHSHSIVAFEKLWSANNNTSITREMINQTNAVVISVCV